MTSILRLCLILVVCIAVAALGCWLSVHYVPAGLARILAEMFSVAGAMYLFFRGSGQTLEGLR